MLRLSETALVLILSALILRACVNVHAQVIGQAHRNGIVREFGDFVNAANTNFKDEELMKRFHDHDAQAGERRAQAQALLKKGDFKGAEKACFQAIDIENDIMRPFLPYHRTYLLSSIYLKADQNEKALAGFRSIVGQYSCNMPMELNMALGYSQMGNYAEALRFYFIGISYDTSQRRKDIDSSNLPGTETPSELHASILLARSFTESDSDLTISDLQAADKFIPKNPTINYYLAEALNHTNRPADAIAHYQIVIQRGNGMLLKNARQGLAYANSTMQTRKIWLQQQAKKLTEPKTQTQGNAAP